MLWWTRRKLKSDDPEIRRLAAVKLAKRIERSDIMAMCDLLEALGKESNPEVRAAMIDTGKLYPNDYSSFSNYARFQDILKTEKLQIPDNVTALTDQEMLDVLRQLCNAYTRSNRALKSRLEPLATQIGEELNRRGGIEEMRRMWNQLDNVPGARTLDMHWDGIGNWQG